MIAETVSIGTELLLGQIVDTNAAYIAKSLSAIGVSLYYRTTVGDNEQRIRDTLRLAFSRADIVITIGGLGPTMDDLSKEMVAEVLDVALIEDKAARARLDSFAASRAFAPPASFYKQALLPRDEDGSGIPNPNGTAPGMLIEKNGKIAICLPGPPIELIPMMEQTVIPRLAKLTTGEHAVIKSRLLRVIGIGEARVEELTKDLMLSENPSVAPYAKLAECHLRITARASSEDAADALIAPREAEIRARLGDAVYGVDDESLESVVVEMLKENGVTIATAESCTGGLLAHRIATISGASGIFHTGVVAYANATKEALLGVTHATLESQGAVSEQTACEMAEGIRDRAGSTIGVGITGIAGPTGGTESKPVGLVYIGVTSPTGTTVERYQFLGKRVDVMNRAAHMALSQIRNVLLKM